MGTSNYTARLNACYELSYTDNKCVDGPRACQIWTGSNPGTTATMARELDGASAAYDRMAITHTRGVSCPS